MAWYAVDLNGSKCRYEFKPIRTKDIWQIDGDGNIENFAKGLINRLTGKNLIWNDELIEVI